MGEKKKRAGERKKERFESHRVSEGKFTVGRAEETRAAERQLDSWSRRVVLIRLVMNSSEIRCDYY